MIFPTDEQTLQADLQSFLSLTAVRQARFDAAPDTAAPAGFRVNEQQRRLHPDKQTMRFSGGTLSPNGLLFCELRTGSGPAALFRPGQQARVYCGEVSYPVYFASAPADAAKGRYLLGVSAQAQPEICSYFESLHEGDTVKLRAPVGSRFYQPLRDGSDLIFVTDPEGLPAAAAFAAACPPGSGTNLSFFCVDCEKEPFFDERFRLVDVSGLPETLPAGTGCFVCGGDALFAAVRSVPAYTSAVSLSVRQPRRKQSIGKTFACTLVTAGGTRVFPCSSDEPLLASLEKAGVRVPANCSNGECGFCRLRLLSGSVTHYDPPEADPRRKADAARSVIHACRVFPDSDLTIAF